MKIVFIFLMILPLLESIVALPFLHDKIPMHYNISGVVDRYGSKYEIFILPIFIIIFSLVLMYVIKKVKSKNNNIYLLCTCLLLIYNVIQIIILYFSLKQSVKFKILNKNAVNIIFVAFGFIMVILGFILPQIKKNSISGFRTPFSIKSDKLWKKSQKFAGYSYIIAGIIMIICSLTSKHIFFIFLFIIIIHLCINLLYEYIIAKRQ